MPSRGQDQPVQAADFTASRRHVTTTPGRWRSARQVGRLEQVEQYAGGPGSACGSPSCSSAPNERPSSRNAIWPSEAEYRCDEILDGYTYRLVSLRSTRPAKPSTHATSLRRGPLRRAHRCRQSDVSLRCCQSPRVAPSDAQNWRASRASWDRQRLWRQGRPRFAEIDLDRRRRRPEQFGNVTCSPVEHVEQDQDGALAARNSLERTQRCHAWAGLCCRHHLGHGAAAPAPGASASPSSHACHAGCSRST